MGRSKKDNEGYYAVSGFVAIVLAIVLHYYFISNMNLHPTLHVSIGLGMFFIISAPLSSILSRFW